MGDTPCSASEITPSATGLTIWDAGDRFQFAACKANSLATYYHCTITQASLTKIEYK